MKPLRERKHSMLTCRDKECPHCRRSRRRGGKATTKRKPAVFGN